MKFIIVTISCLFLFVSGYCQKARLFIKDISGSSIKRTQLNDPQKFATDIIVDTTITVTVYWLDSTINKGRVIELNIEKDRFISGEILEAWKKAPVKSKILFTKAKYFDARKNKFVKLDAGIYEIID